MNSAFVPKLWRSGGQASALTGDGAGVREITVSIWPMVAVLYALLLPREIRLQVGELQFFADRLALVAALPFIIRKLMDGAVRFVLPDFLVLLSGAWMIGAMIYHYGLADGLQRGGSVAIDATIGYYLARITFRRLTDFRRVLILFSPGLLVAGLLVTAESLLQRPFVTMWAESTFGRLPLALGQDARPTLESAIQFRSGLMRASGPFSHPILAGLFLASQLTLYALSGIRGWPRTIGIAASFMAFFTVSSAALLSLMIGLAGIAFEYLTRVARGITWRLALNILIFFLLVIQLTANSGVAGILGRMTFNPETAYFRTLIWEFGTLSVQNYPFFGIGFNQYERPIWMVTGSIDAHWLLLAMRFGIIPALGFLVASISAVAALSRASTKVSLDDRRFYRGIAISLTAMVIGMFSVTLWGAVLSWFNVLLGACVGCAQHSYRDLARLRLTATRRTAVIR